MRWWSPSRLLHIARWSTVRPSSPLVMAPQLSSSSCWIALVLCLTLAIHHVSPSPATQQEPSEGLEAADDEHLEALVETMLRNYQSKFHSIQCHSIVLSSPQLTCPHTHHAPQYLLGNVCVVNVYLVCFAKKFKNIMKEALSFVSTDKLLLKSPSLHNSFGPPIWIGDSPPPPLPSFEGDDDVDSVLSHLVLPNLTDVNNVLFAVITLCRCQA